MKKTLKLLALLAFGGLAALGQTVTVNTTTCGAVTLTANSICLTATTGITDQAVLYVDYELMVVRLSANQAVPTGPAVIPVQRGTRAGYSPAAAHNNLAIVWIGKIPSGTIVPGANGFSDTTGLTAVGPCTRANYSYLPIIYANRGIKRDCSANGFWVDYGDTHTSYNGGIIALTTNGAVAVSTGYYNITKAGVLADTLAAPTAGIQDGTIIQIFSTTANAHTLTATGLFQTGTASVNLATFAASAGAGLTLVANNGKWVVISSVGITFS